MQKQEGQALIIVTIMLFVILYVGLSTIQRRNVDIQNVRSNSAAVAALQAARTGINKANASISAPLTLSGCSPSLPSSCYDTSVSANTASLNSIYISSGDSVYIDLTGISTMNISVQQLNNAQTYQAIVRFFDSQNNNYQDQVVSLSSGNLFNSTISGISSMAPIDGGVVSHPTRAQVFVFSDAFYTIKVQ